MKRDGIVTVTLRPGEPLPDDIRREIEATQPRTPEEVHAAAMADPDAQPLPEDMTGLRPLVNVKRLREALGMSQEDFARVYGIPLGTLRDWEQRRKNPDRTARTYLQVIAADPRTVAALLKAA